MFTNCCIGQRNLHYFLRFLLYLNLSTLYVLALTAIAVVSRLSGLPTPFTSRFPMTLPGLLAATLIRDGAAPSLQHEHLLQLCSVLRRLLPVVAVGTVALAAWAFSALLLAVQLRNLWRGVTYIESCRNPIPRDFDLGGRLNIVSVFGTRLGSLSLSLLAHALPFASASVGNGVDFPRRTGTHREV